MKKLSFEGILGLILLGIASGLGKVTSGLERKNADLNEIFRENSLLDMDGVVNLSELQSMNDNLKKELQEDLELEEIDIDVLWEKISKKKEENGLLGLEIDELSSEIEELETKKESLVNQYEVLNEKYQKILKAKETARVSGNTVMIKGVPTINQYPGYPTGCESVALTILLRYHGINVTTDQIIANLKKGVVPYYEDGVKYGGNPEVEFIGNPYSNSSYGVYQNPVAAVATAYKTGINVKTNFSFDEVLELVSNNRPVLFWTSMYLALPYISDSWIYKSTGETIYWKANEHAVVVIGYNADSVIISDPIEGAVKYQSRSVFESRYNYFGKKALYY